MLKDLGRAEYFAATDDEALDAFQRVSKLEGIIPALETSHAFAHLEVTTLFNSLSPIFVLRKSQCLSATRKCSQSATLFA